MSIFVLNDEIDAFQLFSTTNSAIDRVAEKNGCDQQHSLSNLGTGSPHQ